MRQKQNIWQNLAVIGKNILAHVNITFDGAKGSIRIDIVPTDSRELIVEEEPAKLEQGSDNNESTESDDNTDQVSGKELSVVESQ